MEIQINLSKKKISNISIGDNVYCYNQFDETFSVGKVTNFFTPTIKKECQEEIEIGEETLYTSNIHPFYDYGNKKWIDSREIDEIVGLGIANDGILIKNKHQYKSNTDKTFYDFTVDNYHNYFVGKNNSFTLTHNSATVHFPIWHREIEDILVLKNNKGTEDNRVRHLDYSIQISKLFYERFINNQEISLFSPHDVPGLSHIFGTIGFDNLYLMYEKDLSVPRKTIKAQELFLSLLKERAETGRIYIMNIDHCNEHSSFKEKVSMSNLCQEITLITKPLQHIDDPNGEIALCILSAINVGKLKKLDDLEELCDLSVRALDELIDYQKYPIVAAEKSTKNRRSLGIGYIGLAHYIAKHGYKYWDKETIQLVHDLSEALQYYLLKSSNELAKEKGKCGYFDKTKYSDGILPIDTYKKEVDSIVSNELKYDWESLRSSIVEHGLRNSTLSAQMPSESSSVVSNETNGIEPPRGFLSIKQSKKGPLKQIVPQYNTLKNNYTLLWDMPSNEGYINIVAVMQKFFDQAISANWSYNPENYKDNEVPISVMARDMLETYRLGHKTAYYQNTYDFKKDVDEETKKEIDDLIESILDGVGEQESCDSCTI